VRWGGAATGKRENKLCTVGKICPRQTQQCLNDCLGSDYCHIVVPKLVTEFEMVSGHAKNLAESVRSHQRTHPNAITSISYSSGSHSPAEPGHITFHCPEAFSEGQSQEQPSSPMVKERTVQSRAVLKICLNKRVASITPTDKIAVRSLRKRDKLCAKLERGNTFPKLKRIPSTKVLVSARQ